MALYPFSAMGLTFTLNMILMWKCPGECRVTSLNLPFHFTACVFSLSSQKSADECFTEWQVRDDEKRRTWAVRLHVTPTLMFWPGGFLLRSEKCLQFTRFVCCLPYLFAILHQQLFPSVFPLSVECLLHATTYFVWILGWSRLSLETQLSWSCSLVRERRQAHR